MRVFTYISAAALVAGVLMLVWNPFALPITGIIIIVLNYIIFGSSEPYLSKRYSDKAYLDHLYGMEEYEREEDFDDIENSEIIEDTDFFYVIGILYVLGGVMYLMYFSHI
ncbi:MAG: hypothetical protein R6U61_02925 [Thermoplasmata archaeon]